MDPHTSSSISLRSCPYRHHLSLLAGSSCKVPGKPQTLEQKLSWAFCTSQLCLSLRGTGQEPESLVRC